MTKLLIVFNLFVSLQVVHSDASICPYLLPTYPVTLGQSGCLYGCCVEGDKGCCPEPFYVTFGFVLGMGIGCPILGMIITGTIIYFVCRRRHRIRAEAAARAQTGHVIQAYPTVPASERKSPLN